MKTDIAAIEGALVVRRGSMTRIYPKSAPAYWLDGFGRVGIDIEGGELVRWSAPGIRGLHVIETAPPTLEMDALEAALREVGLAVAGVVDVPGPQG
jgi:hypothetical protein